MNKGLERARGDYIGWINADDAYVQEGIARAVAHLDANAAVGAIYGYMEITDEQGQVTRTYRPPPFNWTRYLWIGDYVPTTAIVFRRALLDRRGLLDETFRDAADYDFYLRLFHGVRVDRIDDAARALSLPLGEQDRPRSRPRPARGPRGSPPLGAQRPRRRPRCAPSTPASRGCSRSSLRGRLAGSSPGAADLVYRLRDRVSRD